MTRTALATLVGLLLGLAFILEGFGEMLIVALFGAIGFGIAKVIEGDVDLNELLSRARGDR